MSKIITEKIHHLKVPESKKPERLDVFLTNHIENVTRTKIQEAIKAGFVTVNNKPTKPNYIVKPQDEIIVIQPIAPRPETVEPENIPLNIIYEDDFLLVVNKPAGMVAHPAYANYTGTLVNALLHHTKKLSQVNDKFRIGIVHRIDKDTSGLLLVAKDDYTHSKLAEQFAKHTIEREYQAVCWGKFKEPKGEIITKITRSKSDRKKFTISTNEGKEAITFYEVLEEFEFATLLKLKLKTGRTHQIRVHLSGIGKPVFGDRTYGGDKIVFGSELPQMKARINNLLKIMQRQALHAKTIGFLHPIKNEFLKFDSELPEDFQDLLNHLRKQN
ncbi:MAG: RluA family pseudouridine synthase [Ignavibacterium sp.]|nr:RluA family pseudouridine synthase [Ignavibacterium sp.]MDW8374659.1 RluA family pseudouridine synthase [Ignavibacteriales bacterium]